ncbi:hypothetical protein [Saccharothrix hoggarensis]|uniref:Uncharacterized protein n=1 Tax=Saccharothrix hoggarensis TaxID=913853 RepID=A0ABW3QSU1_9PSEU
MQFVHDYLQLRFDAPGTEQPVLNCYVMPTAIVEERRYTDGPPGYADALRSLISATVVATEEAIGIGLRIEFDNGTLVLHPTPTELDGPEIAMLNGFTDGQWMCWRPGEDSFEDLA